LGFCDLISPEDRAHSAWHDLGSAGAIFRSYRLLKKAVENDSWEGWDTVMVLTKLCKIVEMLLPLNSLLQGISQGIFQLRDPKTSDYAQNARN
jgi:hypothetical protein